MRTVYIEKQRYLVLFLKNEMQSWFVSDLGEGRWPVIDAVPGDVIGASKNHIFMRLEFQSIEDATLFKMRWL